MVRPLGPLDISAAGLGLPPLSRRSQLTATLGLTVTGYFWDLLVKPPPSEPEGRQDPGCLGCLSPGQPHLTQLLGQHLFLQVQPPTQGQEVVIQVPHLSDQLSHGPLQGLPLLLELWEVGPSMGAGRWGIPQGDRTHHLQPSPAPVCSASPAELARWPAAWLPCSPESRQPAPQPGFPPSGPWCPWELVPLRETVPQLRLAFPSELGQGEEPGCWLQNLPRNSLEQRMGVPSQGPPKQGCVHRGHTESPVRFRLRVHGYSARHPTGPDTGIRKLGTRERSHFHPPSLTPPHSLPTAPFRYLPALLLGQQDAVQ